MNINNHLKPVAIAVVALAMAGAAQAGETIEFGNGAKLDWRVNANYTLGQRMKDADSVIAAAATANDGDNNFAKNALTANRLALLFEGKLSKGESGLVLSASTFYDDVYHNTNDNKSAMISTAGPVNQFSQEAKRYHGGYSRFLDAYGYTSFALGDTSRATVRLGRQAVNWGESTFFANIAAAQGPFDGTKAGVVGTETKDAILPEDQLAVSVEVNSRWTLLAQVQYGFHPTIVSAPGAFMSNSDVVGPGASCAGVYIPPARTVCGGFSRTADVKPSDTGQWGIGTRYRVTDETELGFFYLNYNDRNPSVVLKPTSATTGTYNIQYFDDIKLYGATASTTFGSFSAYGELTQRQGTPLLFGQLATPKRADATMLNLGVFANLGRSPVADSATLLAEVATVKYSGYDGPESGLAFKTDAGTAFTTTLVLGYPGVMEGWDLTVPITYGKQVSGRTLIGTSFNGEGDARYSIGASMTYKGNFSVGVTYNGYMGDASVTSPGYRVSTDRDQLSLNMKYSF